MLNEVFITKIARDVMTKYAAKHGGKNGMSKIDVIEAVMAFGGDMIDVRNVMVEGVKTLLPGKVELE